MAASIGATVRYRESDNGYGGSLSASKVSCRLQADSVIVEISGETGYLGLIRLTLPRSTASSLGGMLLSAGMGGAKGGELQL